MNRNNNDISLNLIVPMAGKGARFQEAGFPEPKPLLLFHGKPLLWWAVESVSRQIRPSTLTFVVLEEHDKDWDISKIILKYYPEAKIICIPEVTSGSAETAYVALANSSYEGPVAFLDCDLVFDMPNFQKSLMLLQNGYDGLLCCFKSNNPAYSYAVVNGDEVTTTVEKKVVSEYAVAGLYTFSNAEVFNNAYLEYVQNCPYEECFMSGIYNFLVASGLKITFTLLNGHISLGTPEEYLNFRDAYPAWLEDE